MTPAMKAAQDRCAVSRQAAALLNNGELTDRDHISAIDNHLTLLQFALMGAKLNLKERC